MKRKTAQEITAEMESVVKAAETADAAQAQRARKGLGMTRPAKKRQKPETPPAQS